ncbi:MAG: sugar ABC transporter permease [Chloroflexi bacterium]|nr:sugar ABC transporter permease [Chloroflexota bacterium]
MSERGAPWLFILPAFFFLVAVVAFPVLYTVAISLTRWSAAVTEPPTWIGLANYADMATASPEFRNALLVSIYFTGVSVAIEIVLGIALAQLLNRDFVGKGLVRTLLLLPVAGTPVAFALVWRNMYNPSYGIMNWFMEQAGLPHQRWLAGISTVIPSLILFDVWQWTPLVMLITLAAMEALPTDPYEAAVIDGAGPVELFRHITLPLIRPAVFAVMALRLMDSFKTFDQIYVTTQGGPGTASQTLILYVFDQAFRYLKIGYASAVIIVLFLMILASNLAVVYLRRAAA